MKKSLLALSLSAALTCGVVAPAHAQEAAPAATDQLSGQSVSSDSTEEAGSSKAGTAIAVILGVGAVAGLVAAGVSWAVANRMIPNPLPGIIPDPPAPAPAPAPVQAVAPAPAPAPAQVSRTYANCTEVWNVLGRPIHSNEPGFHSGLDRDGDGVGCESRPK